jgi:hypothetical protein
MPLLVGSVSNISLVSDFFGAVVVVSTSCLTGDGNRFLEPSHFQFRVKGARAGRPQLDVFELDGGEPLSVNDTV